MNRIPEVFKGEDVIYHYTTLDTAIKYILHNKELRLSKRVNSIDPIERWLPNINSQIIETDRTEFNYKVKEDDDSIGLISKEVFTLLKNAKQVCFCMNNNDVKLDIEYYGFIKPRMWDQYGDKYKGVCLAFSKVRLLESNEFIGDDVNYCNYNNLKNNLEKDFKLNNLKENLKDKIKPYLFRKHKDYTHENEFRISLFENNDIKQQVKFRFLDIKESLIGIIIPSDIGCFDEQIEKYIKEFHKEDKRIELLYLTWNESKPVIETREEKESGRRRLDYKLNGPKKKQ